MSPAEDGVRRGRDLGVWQNWIVPVNRFAMAGWAAFSLSGVFYLVSSIRAGDIWSAMGSIVWLIGIGFFLASYRPN